jgi:MFS family permease
MTAAVAVAATAATSAAGTGFASAASSSRWITRDVLLISLSAFFADMGYQAVTAVFPLLIVVELKEPAYVYGLLLALSYGVGSLFSLYGGRLGEKHDKKRLALIGNLLIPLMSISVLSPNVVILGALFVLGWWARYFRTPTRRAWLVEVSDPAHRSRVFGFLHALDVGGGMIAVVYSVVLLLLGFSVQAIVLVTAIPLIVSSLSLALAGTTPDERFLLERDSEVATGKNATGQEKGVMESFVFRMLLLSATLFGFSYYALGFPIVTVARSQGSAVLGIITFGIYLGVSALAGYSLGALRSGRPLRTLWSLGYLVAAASSLVIGISYLSQSGLGLYYLGAAGLGFATGSVETFEPVLTSTLAKSRLSSGMGWLSSSRAIGLFVSNIAMGILFTFNEFDSYLYAAITAAVAAAVLLFAEKRSRMR